MKLLILSAVVILVTFVKAQTVPIPEAYAEEDSPKPSEDSDDVLKIVGGSPVSIQQYPYMVSLQMSNQHICGGSILNRNTVLTAAHCVASNQGYSVRVGSRDWPTGGQTARVSRITRHPNYNRGVQFDYDVAVLKLASNLVFNNNVGAVTLASARPADNAVSTVIGWGRLSETGAYPRQLYAVNVNVINQGRCGNTYGRARLTDRMICAAARGRDACYGDSGGPLVANNRQIGIVSWGSKCGSAPGVYASVPELRSFINSNL